MDLREAHATEQRHPGEHGHGAPERRLHREPALTQQHAQFQQRLRRQVIPHREDARDDSGDAHKRRRHQ